MIRDSNLLRFIHFCCCFMDQSNGDTIIGNTNHLTEVFSRTIFLGMTREGPRRPVMARVSPPPDLENPSVTISHPWLPGAGRPICLTRAALCAIVILTPEAESRALFATDGDWESLGLRKKGPRLGQILIDDL